MNVHVIIPWQSPGDDTADVDMRLTNLGWIGDRWHAAFPEFTQTLGALSHDSDWCKADAVQVAIHARGVDDDDILIIADADVWAEPDAITEAVDRVATGDVAWAMPHTNVLRLSLAATLAVVNDPPVDDDPTVNLTAAIHRHGLDRLAYVGTVGGGMTILTAANYHRCPLDPRFVGWGQEDEAWGDALRTVLGRRHRGNHDLWHLWHPPMPRMAPGIGSIQGRHLRDRYQRLTGDVDRMMQLVDSGRDHLITLAD